MVGDASLALFDAVPADEKPLVVHVWSVNVSGAAFACRAVAASTTARMIFLMGGLQQESTDRRCASAVRGDIKMRRDPLSLRNHAAS